MAGIDDLESLRLGVRKDGEERFRAAAHGSRRKLFGEIEAAQARPAFAINKPLQVGRAVVENKDKQVLAAMAGDDFADLVVGGVQIAEGGHGLTFDDQGEYAALGVLAHFDAAALASIAQPATALVWLRFRSGVREGKAASSQCQPVAGVAGEFHGRF